MSIDLDAIRARCEAATEGPWTYEDDRPRFITTGAPIAVDEADWGPEGHTAMALRTMEDPRAWKYDDVRFVANARQDIPDLLAEVERLVSEVERLRDVLDRSRVDWETEVERLRAEVADSRGRLALGALRDSEAFPDPDVANYVARWLRDEDYPIAADGHTLGILRTPEAPLFEIKDMS